LYNILVGLTLVVSCVFATLVVLTGKGDAMGGGGGVRTTFKGKASFDDLMTKILMGLGGAMMGLLIIIEIYSQHGMPK
jgi:preprotein translocase subunit SecG